MKSEIIITSKEELAEVLEGVILKVEKQKKKEAGEKVFYIHQVAKMLGKAHVTIRKAVKNGIIRTTKDGLIPESAIEEYLNPKIFDDKSA